MNLEFNPRRGRRQSGQVEDNTMRLLVYIYVYEDTQLDQMTTGVGQLYKALRIKLRSE